MASRKVNDADLYLQVHNSTKLWKKISPANSNLSSVIKNKPANLNHRTAIQHNASTFIKEQKDVIEKLQNAETRAELFRKNVPNNPHFLTLKQIQAHFHEKAKNLGTAFEEGPPWRGKLVAQCGPWIAAQCDEKRKKAAETYCNYLRYIPHNEFVDRLVALYEKLKQDGVITKRTYFIIDEYNSSEYCAIILQRKVAPDLSKRILYYNCTGMVYTKNDFARHVLELVSTGDPIRLLDIDDMTYSATQAMNNHTLYYRTLYGMLSGGGIRYPFITQPSLVTAFMEALGISHHVAFVYATKQGEGILKGQIPYRPFREEDTIPLFYPLGVTVSEVLPSIRESIGDVAFEELGAYFGWPSSYDSKTIAPDAIVYFDHKIADEVSVMGMPLLTGRLALTKANVKRMNEAYTQAKNSAVKYDNNNEYDEELPFVPTQWVKNYVSNNGSDKCNTETVVPLLELCARGVEEEDPYGYPEIRCPPPWYKGYFFSDQTSEFKLYNRYKKRYPHLLPEKGGSRHLHREKRHTKKAHRKRSRTIKRNTRKRATKRKQ